jgi:Ca2+-binding EF-hand superfamily protein
MQQTFKVSNQIAFIAILSSAFALGASVGNAADMKAQAEEAKNSSSMFSKLDANGDGYVTVEEAAGQLSPEAFSTIDKNRDGKLDAAEFKVSGLDESK